MLWHALPWVRFSREIVSPSSALGAGRFFYVRLKYRHEVDHGDGAFGIHDFGC